MSLLVEAFAGLISIAVASVVLLKGWNGWLELRRLQLGGSPSHMTPSPAARIELADLKERVRKLEAIANGDA